IDCIDPLDEIDQSPGNIARAGAYIKNGSRLISNKTCENVKNLVRIRRAITIGINDMMIFERFSVICAEALWFWLHVSSLSNYAALAFHNVDDALANLLRMISKLLQLLSDPEKMGRILKQIEATLHSGDRRIGTGQYRH